MVQKIQEKCPEISETVELPKCEFTRMILEIPGAKLDGKKTSGKKFFEHLGIPHEVVLFFGNFENFEKSCSIHDHSLLKVAENSNQTFWLNGKRL